MPPLYQELEKLNFFSDGGIDLQNTVIGNQIGEIHTGKNRKHTDTSFSANNAEIKEGNSFPEPTIPVNYSLGLTCLEAV